MRSSALVERNAIPAEEYDDVIFGCVDTIGALAGDIARTAWLAAGMPLCVPGTTVAPPVRQLAASHSLCRPGGDERHARRGAGRSASISAIPFSV